MKVTSHYDNSLNIDIKYKTVINILFFSFQVSSLYFEKMVGASESPELSWIEEHHTLVSREGGSD